MSTILISLFKRNMDICVVKTLCGQWPEVPSIDRYLKLFLMTIYYERKNLDVHDVIKKFNSNFSGARLFALLYALKKQ